MSSEQINIYIKFCLKTEPNTTLIQSGEFVTCPLSGNMWEPIILNKKFLSCLDSILSVQPEKMAGTLKEQLNSITPALREMRLRKEERVNQFRAVQTQIKKISAEISGLSEYDDSSTIIVNENDLSLKKLEEYQIELQRLHNEKVLPQFFIICIRIL